VSKSDHDNQPRTNIFELLPEVLHSETNRSVFETSFNRHLTKDDTTHLSGFVGQPNPSSLTNRQLPEPTPQLQAFQLAPTIYTKVGSVETAMTFKNYQQQLTLMGVDFDRMQKWGNTIQFNWIPPVNIDMLVNFVDYYWAPDDRTDQPQYLTIEDRCRKQQNVLNAYNTLVETYGETFPIVEIDVVNNCVVIDGRYDGLFIEGFQVWIKGTDDINIRNRFFTVSSSLFSLSTRTTPVVDVNATSRLWMIDGDFRDVLPVGASFTISDNTGGANGTFTVSSTTFSAGVTTILVNEDIPLTATGDGTCTIDISSCAEDAVPSQTTVCFDPDASPMAIRSSIEPPPSLVGRYWVNTSTDEVFCWDGLDWVPCTPIASGILSLAELHNIIRADTNCVCTGDYGWDLALWDDNQETLPPWYTLLGPYAQPTEADWITFNGAPTALALWLDTTQDILFQRNPANTTWIAVVQDWTAFIGDKLLGDVLWDLTTSCFNALQEGNQWTQQNRWIHKSQVQSFAGVRRAQIPILEYDSRTELNEWTKVTYSWKYRPTTSGVFSATTSQPTRLELEPVKGWIADQPGGAGTEWFLYLFDKSETEARDTNYTDTFVPGFHFLVKSDLPVTNNTFTVDYSIYREGGPTDPADVQGRYMVTIVKLIEAGPAVDVFFATYPTGGGPTHLRLEPSLTSLGDTWRGYHVHWVMNTASQVTTAEGSIVGNPLLRRAIEDGDPYSFFGNPAIGPMTVGQYFQETTVTGVGVTTIPLDASFQFINETAFTINGVIVGVNGTWQITGNFASFFFPNMSFVIPDNTGGGDGIYTVLSATNVGLNTNIVVNETIPAAANASGTITTGRSLFALAGQDQLRVYVNDVRQYGQYVETTTVGTPDYTVVGTSIYTSQTFGYVTQIIFTTPLTQYDIVRIEVGPASLSDMGLQYVPVRTIEDEVTFLAAVIAGTQPEYLARETYKRNEQAKILINQYPLFNVYNVCTGEIIKASPIFSFQEDPSAPINRSVQKRITVSDGGREFGFEQFLLAEDNGQIYGYRLHDGRVQSGDYWYNTSTQVLKQWDGDAWQSLFVIQDANDRFETHAPFVGTDPPAYLVTIVNSIYYDPEQQIVFRSNGTTWSTEAQPKQDDSLLTPVVCIEGADPTLTTIWRSVPQYTNGTSGPPSDWTGGVYIPEWVDGNRNPLPVGDPTGDWEIPDQWRFNPEHHNRAVVAYSELVSHFRSIIAEQPNPFAFPGGTVSALTQGSFNYSLGGTIKEHNDSYDTLISAVNETVVTPLGIIDFAQQQYASLLLAIKELYTKNVLTMLSTINTETITDLQGFINETIQDAYEANDFYGQVYVDTSAFDNVTDIGVRHWVATVPMFALGPKTKPIVDIDSKLNIYQILHHDGHRSGIDFTAAEEDSIARILCSLPDTRVTNGTLGKISTTAPPCFMSTLPFILPPGCPLTTFVAEFGVIRNGVYWYQTIAPRVLYRFNVIAVSPVAPSSAGVPIGALYWNTTFNQLFEWNGVSWVAAAPAGEISIAWQQVDMRALLANTILSIEEQLHAVTPDFAETAFDYSSLTPDVSEQAFFDEYTEDQFFAFVAARRIRAPFENVLYNPSDAFTWNYVYSNLTTPPTFSISPGLAGSWQQLYTLWYNTPYPHLEPWKLQGFADKPDWWDAFYLETNGTRRWIYNHGTTTGMWENIRVGTIPVGGTAPDGSPGTGLPGQVTLVYNYFSVNISDGVIQGNYAPDDLLPPYYTTVSSIVRSFFTSLSTEIVAPGANYAFGDGGPVEWQWLVSGEHVYDPLVIAFRMQPVRFMHYAWGIDFIRVNNLQIDPTFCQVYNHEDALFHGDIYNNDVSFLARGLNQWYVNYDRFVGYDTNKEFRILWTAWDPLLSYQFSGIIDTSTLEVSNKYFDVGPQDYNVLLANMGVIKDMWSDAFEVVVLNMPPQLVQYNSQTQWKLEIETLASIPRDVSYYDVINYPFTVDILTNTATIFRYTITGALSVSNLLEVDGDHVTDFPPDQEFDVINSTGNDGSYTVVASIYDPSVDRTRITTLEPLPSSIANGLIDFPLSVLPWQTGDLVFVTSSKLLPAPLVPNQPLYIIRLNNRQFRVAESPNAALAGVPFVWTTTGTGDLNVGQVDSSFQVFGGAGPSTEIWYHYALDKTKVRTFIPPYSIAGIQRLINIIDGYAAYQKDIGVLYNLSDFTELDPETGRTVNWQLEEERFIDWAFRLRRTRMSVADKYQFTVTDLAANTMTFSGQVPMWQPGTAILMSSTGLLPEPFIANTPYYYNPTGVSGEFRLSTTRMLNASIVDVLTNGSGVMFIAPQSRPISFPSFELNAARNNVWIDTPQGVLSDVVQGPYADIRVQQTIFDQYARPISADKLLVFREDKQSRLAMRTELPNDTVPPSISTADPYNYIHMGGAHLFIEGYEHICLFNDYTTSNQILYDSFLGLTAQRFGMDFYEKNDFSLRPTLGGYYLLGGKYRRNIEGQTVDSQNYYDTYGLKELTKVGLNSRQLLGYRAGSQPYLDLLNTNAKTQFVFYRGMIQAKGSTNAIKAYINSRRFVDAKIDEFWAWKIAQFGDVRPRVYPEIKLFASDGQVDDVRLEFLTDTEASDTAQVEADEAMGFKIVTFSNQDRWIDAPEQRVLLDNSILFLDSQVTTLTTIYASDVVPTAGEETVDMWYEKSTGFIFIWDGTQWVQTTDVPVKITTVAGDIYIQLPTFADTVRVTNRDLVVAGDLRNYTTAYMIEGTGADEFSRINSEVIRFTTTGFTDIIMIFTINPGKTKNSPAKIIDYVAGTVLTNVPMWDPARGYHSPTAVHNVDIQNAVDPALYTNTLNPNDISQQPWNQAETQTVWLDTATLAYRPYYDDVVLPDLNDRLYNWGRLADWGDVRVYQWVESQFTPEEWAATAVDETNDTAIASNDKITGTPRMTTFFRERTPISATVNVGTDEIAGVNTLSIGDEVVLVVNGTITPTRPTTGANPDLFDSLATSMTAVVTITVVPAVFETSPAIATVTFYDTPAVVPTTLTNLAIGSYDFTLAVNGGAAIDYTITITSASTTVTQLAALMQTALTGVATTVEAVESTIVITTFDLQLPLTTTTTLAGSTKYFATLGTTSTITKLSDTENGTPFEYGTAGIGTLEVVPAFKATSWVRKPIVSQKIIPIIDGYTLPVPATFTLDSDLFASGDVVNMYVNGVVVETGLVVDNSLEISNSTSLTINDIVTVVRPIPVLTEEQITFDPDTTDDGTTHTQFKQQTEYTQRVVTIDNVTRSLFYFWVENRLNKIEDRNDALPLIQVAQQIEQIPTPYLVVQRPEDDPTLADRFGYGITFGIIYSAPWIYDQYPVIPVFYRQAIIRKAADFIRTDDRYEVRFTRDLTLRDTLDDGPTPLNLKNKHEEWLAIRRSQGANIDRRLWDRLTESLIGYKLADPSVRVPALERTLYDEISGTDTQYGLGVDQSFTDGTLSLQTVIAYLEDPNNDFYPLDINSFFATFSFDTSENIATAMDAIYNTFGTEHVNNIWFNCLLDALSVKSKYREIFKTSWVALHGIRVLEVAGIFDD